MTTSLSTVKEGRKFRTPFAESLLANRETAFNPLFNLFEKKTLSNHLLLIIIPVRAVIRMRRKQKTWQGMGPFRLLARSGPMIWKALLYSVFINIIFNVNIFIAGINSERLRRRSSPVARDTLGKAVTDDWTRTGLWMPNLDSDQAKGRLPPNLYVYKNTQ